MLMQIQSVINYFFHRGSNMKLDSLIKILENKKLSLLTSKTLAENTGDVESVVKIEQEIIEINLIIDKLKS